MRANRWAARWFLLVLACAVSLAGCMRGIQPGADDRRQWALSGKIGLRAEGFAESALINWRQCGETFDIRLTGPLGQAAAHIGGRGEYLVVQMRGREPVVTREPETLLQQEFGWSVPLRALRYWVRAEAAPGGGAEFLAGANDGLLAGLVQHGWEVRYRDWHQRDDLALPAKLVLTGRDLRATLLIREWQLSEAVAGCTAS